MHNGKRRQTAIWLAAAVSAPLAHYSGSGWLSLLVAAVILLPLGRLGGEGWQNLGKTAARLEYLWICVILGALLRSSTACWPSQGNWTVPLTLLVLAAMAKSEAAPRAGAVVGLLLAVLYLPVALSAAGQIEWSWLKPEWKLPVPELAAVLLMPALTGVWSEEQTPRFGIGAMAAALAGLTQGLLSYQVASSLDAPFYEVARTVSHLEAAIAAAMTLGWYAMAVFLMSAAVKLIKTAGLKEKPTRWSAAIIAAISMVIHIEWLIAPVTIFLWVALPFLHRKKVAISENNA